MQFGKLIKFTVPAVLFVAIVIQWQFAYTSVNGPDPGYTGAPGENGNCTSCHSGSATTSSSSIKLKTHQSATTLEYLPDSTYTITVDFNPSSGSKYGFQATALINSSSRMAGTFTITNSTATKSASATFNSNTRYYVEHTNNGTSSKTWSFDWKAPSTNVGDIVFYVAANAANGTGSSSGDAIHTNSFTFKPSSKLPTASIVSPSTSVNVCVGDSLAFSGGGTNSPTSYKWTINGGTPSTSTLQNPKVQFKTVGNYSVRLSVANAFGVSTEVVRNISVKAIPADSIAVTGAKTICEGDSVKLTAAVGAKYEWSTGETTPIIYAKTSGNYTVKVSNNFGCAVTSKPVVIKVLDKPKVTLTRTYGSDEICEYDSLVFEATSGASTYTFYNGKSMVQQSASHIYTAKNLVPGNHIFYVLLKDSNGCQSDTSAKFAITVTEQLAAPTITCGTPTTNTVTLNWNAVSGAASYEVSADTGKTWTNTTNVTYTVGGLKADENVRVQVRAVSNNVCKTGLVASVTCKSLPCSQLTYNIFADTMLCRGDSALIRFDNLSSPTYYIRLNGEAASKQTTYFFSPLTADTTLQFALYDSLKPNCPPIEHNFRIRTDELPPLTIDADKFTYCENESVKLLAGAGYAQYRFYRNNSLVGRQTNPDFEYTGINDKDTLHVVAETVNGCETASTKRIIDVVRRTNPGFTYTSDKLVLNFSDTTKLATNRKWNFGDGESSTDMNPTHTYASAGQYTVWLYTTNREGCTDSVSKTLNVSTVGVQEWNHLQQVNIYPVPFQSEVNITVTAKQSAKIQLSISDIKGRTVLNKTYQAKPGRNDIQVTAENLPGGVYLVRIQCGKEIVTRKITKSIK